MMRALLLAALIGAGCGGCTSVAQPENEVRVTEYRAGSSGLLSRSPVQGDGCRLVWGGAPPVDTCFVYQGERCYVRKGDCSGEVAK